MAATRTAAQVEADILTTRAALIAADAEAGEHALDPQAWTEADALFDQLVALGAEFAAIPHQRLPSDHDGHQPPQTVR